VNAPTTPDPRLDRAFDLYEAGDLDGAIDVCDAILRRDAKHYGALYLFGSILGEKKKFDDAAALLGRAIAVDPSRPLAHFNFANVLRRLGRYEEALVAIDAHLALKPEKVEAIALRADSCIELGRPDEALRSAERAIALAPADPEAHNIRGAALAELDRCAEARASFDRAVALNPRMAKAFRNRALAELQLNEHNRALASFEQALAVEPNLDYVDGMMCHTRQKICAWSGLDAQIARIRQAVAAGRRAAMCGADPAGLRVFVAAESGRHGLLPVRRGVDPQPGRRQRGARPGSGRVGKDSHADGGKDPCPNAR